MPMTTAHLGAGLTMDLPVPAALNPFWPGMQALSLACFIDELAQGQRPRKQPDLRSGLQGSRACLPLPSLRFCVLTRHHAAAALNKEGPQDEQWLAAGAPWAWWHSSPALKHGEAGSSDAKSLPFLPEPGWPTGSGICPLGCHHQDL